jgi:hypothetical protein
LRLAFFAVLILAALSPARAEPMISVTPSAVVEGEPVRVVVTGLQPGQTLTLHASRVLPADPTGMDSFRGAATFTADARGLVDLGASPAAPGSSYEGIDPSGLFWSMSIQRPASGGNPPGEPPPGIVLLEAEIAGVVVARAEAHLHAGAEDVAVSEIRDPSVTGVFAMGRSTTPQPAIIVLGGSEGGLFTARWAAPILASRGFAVLGLGYFQGGEPDLKALPFNLENIPLEKLEQARDWLARQPGVDASRIAIVGVSKGAEMALVAAATFPWVTAVGAFAPSHVVWEGIPPDDQPDRAAGSSWTYRDRPLPYVRWSKAAEQRGDLNRRTTGSSRLTEPHLESLAEFASDVPAATILIEKSRAAVFIAAGTDDGMWPSAYSAEHLRRRLALRDPSLAAVFEIHPTGHQIMGSGWGPTTQFQRATGHLQGGNARLDAQAQGVIWPAFLKFLDQHLAASSSSQDSRLHPR